MPAEFNIGREESQIDVQNCPSLTVNQLTLPISSSKAATSSQAANGEYISPLRSRILLIDIDAENRKQISDTVADLNLELVEVSSTSAALNAINALQQGAFQQGNPQEGTVQPGSLQGGFLQEGNTQHLSSRTSFDLVMVDATTPELGGVDLCRILRNKPVTRITPIFMLAKPEDRDLEVQAFSAGADEFFVAPLKRTALRARVHATLRMKAMMESLDSAESVLFSLAKSVEDRDADLGEHCQRLALMASAMGLALGLDPGSIRALQHGGYLHDIGKIGIPDRVLFKAGPLTPDEWEIMRSHSVRGERICSCMKSLAPMLPIIRHHHEKFDGTGYPDGLKGEEIPLLARILQVVDIYDALTTERPYKRAYTPEEALVIMREETKKGWRDPALVEVFSDLLPMFRHISAGDSTRTSLQHLADSIDLYRKSTEAQQVVS